jgi:DNA-binding CsgD family transcriptional regulator
LGDIPTEAFYEAALDDEAFARLPSLLIQASDARSAMIQWRHQDGVFEVLAFNHFSPDWMARYPEFAASDPWLQAALAPGRQNQTIRGDMFVSDAEFENSVVYNEWVRAQGDDTFNGMGACLTSPWGFGLISVHRGRGARPFKAAEAARLDVNLGALQKVLRLRGEMASLRRKSQAAKGALDELATPVLIVGADGRLMQANAAAEEVLQWADGLSLKAGRLVASSAQCGTRLNAAIGQATRSREPSISYVSIGRGPDLAPYLVTAVPLLGRGGPALAMLIFRDPDRDAPISTDRLRAFFGLSAAEAAVALDLARGRIAPEIAALRGVSAHTLKAQLRSIAAKLGVSRQSEIAAKIAALPPISTTVAA